MFSGLLKSFTEEMNKPENKDQLQGLYRTNVEPHVMKAQYTAMIIIALLLVITGMNVYMIYKMHME
jgi:hypothetical protein